MGNFLLKGLCGMSNSKGGGVMNKEHRLWKKVKDGFPEGWVCGGLLLCSIYFLVAYITLFICKAVIK